MAGPGKKQVKEGQRKKGSARSLDKDIGERLRILRALRGYSQVGLGKRVNVTFQQIQKYEWGDNRISASRLMEFANILGVSPNYFFGLEDAKETKKLFKLQDEDAIRVAESFQELPNKELKKMVFNIIKTINKSWREEKMQEI